MQNKDFSASCLLSVKPSLRHNRTNLISGLLVIALLATGFAFLAPVASASDSSVAGKISARLLFETADGGKAEALVVLAEQADLTGAASLRTKLEKGRYVFQALQSVAQTSQASLASLLQQRGIPFQPFYIVNMIKVTVDRSLLEELAA